MCVSEEGVREGSPAANFLLLRIHIDVRVVFFFDDTTPCLNTSQNIEPLSMIYLTALMVRFLI